MLGKKCLSAMAMILALGAVNTASAATSFNFQFDNQGLVLNGDGPLSGPIVGTGTFNSPVNLNPGVYALTALTGFSFNFTIDGNSFDQSHIFTPLAGVAVRIESVNASTQRLFFTETGLPDSNGGPLAGALDLSNGNNFLSFEPSFSGGNFLYATDGGYGRYLALGTSGVPEPSTWALMLLGFGAVGGMLRTSRRRASVAVANA